MAKRFIDTNLFKSNRIKRLSSRMKLLYLYLLCEADHTGVWRVELDVAELRIGMALPPANEILAELGGFAVPFDHGSKWFLPDFIVFQYGELNPANRVHKSILDAISRHGLTGLMGQNSPSVDQPNPTDALSMGHTNPLHGVMDMDMDMDKEQDQETVKDKTGTKKKNAPDPDFIKTYTDFLESKGIPVRINGVDAVALKNIQTYMAKHESVTTGSKTALELWKTFLDNWQHLTAWQQTQIQPRQINSQLPNMIETIKQVYNGKRTQSTNSPASVAGLAAAIRSKLDGIS